MGKEEGRGKREEGKGNRMHAGTAHSSFNLTKP